MLPFDTRTCSYTQSVMAVGEAGYEVGGIAICALQSAPMSVSIGRLLGVVVYALSQPEVSRLSKHSKHLTARATRASSAVHKVAKCAQQLA